MVDNKEQEDVSIIYIQVGGEELDPILMMEELLDKLKVLSYETLFLKTKYLINNNLEDTNLFPERTSLLSP